MGKKTGFFFPITLPVSPRVACPCFIKDLHLFIGHHRPYQERGRSGRDGERKTTLQREEDGEVLSTSLPNNTTLPLLQMPRPLGSFWLLVTSLPSLIFSLSLSFLSFNFSPESIPPSPVCLHLDTSLSLSYNNISAIHHATASFDQ